MSEEAIAQCEKILGKSNIIYAGPELEKYSLTTGKLSYSPLAVLKPENSSQISEIIKIANQYSVSIYPVSRGKNWGYGSSVPLKEKSFVIDLSGLNKIIEVNVQLAYAVIEPGVTPWQLYNYLKDNNIPLRLDTSGAPRDSSLIANLCEKGHGFTRYSDHFHNSCCYEVSLPDGSVINTGFGNINEAKPLSYLYKSGVGPSFDGLFAQSNFGIITKACIWLMPASEYFGLLHIKMQADKNLYEAVDKIRQLKLNGILQEALHFYNPERIRLSIGGQVKSKALVSEWNLAAGLHGSKRHVRFIARELKTELKNIASVKFYPEKFLNLAIKIPGISILNGINTSEVRESIEMLKGRPAELHKNFIFEEDNTYRGLYWYAPVFPATARDTENLLSFTRKILQRYKYKENISLIFFNERSLCAIIGVIFDKKDKTNEEAALQCYRDLVSEGLKNGYVPYRISPEVNDLIFKNGEAMSFYSKLKNAIDPAGIMSPGRYSR